MSKLLALRQKFNLTQEELFERSGVSVRTIQRIEAGTPPKGYTLKALAKGLGVNEADLMETEEITTGDMIQGDDTWIKVINLSALPCMFIPPLNIAAPLLIMFIKKQFTPVAKAVVSIQIVWTLVAVLLLLIIQMLIDWFSVSERFALLIALVWLLFNSIVILRNAVEINKRKTLRMFMNLNIL